MRTGIVLGRRENRQTRLGRRIGVICACGEPTIRVRSWCVADLDERQPVRRCDPAPVTAILGLEDATHVVRFELPPTHIDENGHERPHHLMAEGGCGDIEPQQPVVATLPFSVAHTTDGAAIAGAATERSKVVLADQMA